MLEVLDQPRRKNRNATPAFFAGSVCGGLGIRVFKPESSDSRSTPEAGEQHAYPLPPQDLSGFKDIYVQIGSLADGEEQDEYGVLRPTAYAQIKAQELLVEALAAKLTDAMGRGVKCVFPRGAVATDEKGGIRIEWADMDRAVHLIVPASEGGKAYIYHEKGDEYGTEKRLSGGLLARWLQLFD